ncbi:MAG TPA: hypothetical protein VJJ54_04270, partial [Gemmatimonadales bacterium]|nr:hypothetical protein [Gemmatimonadales bacterium]
EGTGMRWTKAWFAAAVTASTLACFKSAAKKAAEVRECSRITMNAQGAAQCLVLQYKWNQDAALTAATAYQQQQDSIAQLHADATWRAEAARHKNEIAECAKDPSGDVTRCLMGYGWAEARAVVTEDSLWRHDAANHRQQVATCTRQRKMQAGSCLQLYYKWNPARALAVDDSIRRAQMRR